MIQAGEKLGIKVSNEEILDILIENPPDYLRQSFTDTTGFFNKELYLKMIANPEIIVNYIGQDPTKIDQATKNQYINDFRNQLIVVTEYLRIQKINEALSNTLNTAYAVSSPSYIEKKFTDDNSTADANFIFINQVTIPDSMVKIEQNEMKEYYEKNKQNFKVKNERKVKAILFPIIASADDSTRNNTRIEKITQEITNAATTQQRDSIFTQKMNEFAGTEND